MKEVKRKLDISGVDYETLEDFVKRKLNEYELFFESKNESVYLIVKEVR